jgi:hypothetical protein
MDPVTAAIIQGTLAGGQALYGLDQQRRAQQGLAMMNDPLDTTPASRLRMLNAAQDQTVANQAVEQINRSLGTSVNALQTAGSRAAGALSGVQRAADQAKTDVLFRQRQQEMNALARANQGAERDRLMQSRQFQADRAALQQARQAGVQNIGNAAIALGSGLAQLDYGTKAERQEAKAGRQANRQEKRQLRRDLRDTRRNDRAMRKDKSFDSQLLSSPNTEDSFNVMEQSETIKEKLMPGGPGSFNMSEQSETIQDKLMPNRSFDIDEQSEETRSKLFPGNEYTRSIQVKPFDRSAQSDAMKRKLTPGGSFDMSTQSDAMKRKLIPGGSFDMSTQSDAMKRKLMPGIAKPKSLDFPGVEIEEEEIDKVSLLPGRSRTQRLADEFLEQQDVEDERLNRMQGRTYFRNKGGKAKKTPGKFSHKTNPLHIVSDNGSKVGEMTGGEYIFNPKQAASLRKHSKGGSSPLHKFVRQMLSKSQFK